MPNTTSNRLRDNIPKIMNVWVQRADLEIKAAHHQETLALKNSLPEYLNQMADALSNTVDRTKIRISWDKSESTRVGKKHGHERANSHNYTMDQLIVEYHILRQSVCDVMEEEIPLTVIEREIIVCSIEQAVNDAATQFSDTLKDIQEQLSQTLAHDLRNPISAARVSASLILRRPDDQNNCLKNASRISSCLERLDKMISDLLDASRIRSGQRIPIQYTTCDLDWIGREVSNEFNISQNSLFQMKSDGVCVGNWNEDGLRRVLENLSSNAVKYGFKNKPIIMTLSQDDVSATISVHNEGNPILKEDLPILFEQFKRSRMAENKTGWGLGLTMVKGMVEAHKGSIKVESEEGEGTTFTITLPKNPELLANIQ